jgi:imidazolonepropionase-like amidohydrolase
VGELPAQLVSLGSTVRRIVSGGGHVIAGTDSPIIPFGLSLHIELQNYVDGGLTPVEALRTATSAFADAVGASDLGTIAPGMFADMVIVDGNPLEDITATRRVRVVLKNGDVFTYERLLEGPVSPRGVVSALP